MPREEIRGRHIRDFFGEKGFARIKPFVERALNGEATESDLSVGFPKKGLRHVFASFIPRYDAQGDINGVHVFISDNTEKREAEASLLQSERRSQQQLAELEDIYASSPTGMCYVDTDLRYVRINENLARINGWPTADHIGRTTRDIIPEVADIVEPLYCQIIQTGEPIIDLDLDITNPARAF